MPTLPFQRTSDISNQAVEQIVLGIEYNDILQLNGNSDVVKRLHAIGVLNAIRKNHQSPTPPTRTPRKNKIQSMGFSAVIHFWPAIMRVHGIPTKLRPQTSMD